VVPKGGGTETENSLLPFGKNPWGGAKAFPLSGKKFRGHSGPIIRRRNKESRIRLFLNPEIWPGIWAGKLILGNPGLLGVTGAKILLGGPETRELGQHLFPDDPRENP